MTLIHHPGSYHQMARTGMDAGTVRDIALMLTDAHAVISGLAGGGAPAAACQAAAIPADTDSPYTLQGLADAVSETVSMLYRALDDALAGVPDQVPGL